MRCNAGWRLKGAAEILSSVCAGGHDFANGVSQDGLEQHAVKVKDMGPALLVSPEGKLLADERVDLGPDRALGNVWAHSRIGLGTCVRPFGRSR